MFLLRRRQHSPKLRLLEATVSIRLATAKLSILVNRVKRIVAQNPNDKQAIETLRKLVKLQLVLEAVALRLETLATTNIVSAEELSTVKEVIKVLGNEYKNIMPGIISILDDVDRAIVEVASTSRIELVDTMVSVPTESARRILEQAEHIAKERLYELLPRERRN